MENLADHLATLLSTPWPTYENLDFYVDHSAFDLWPIVRDMRIGDAVTVNRHLPSGAVIDTDHVIVNRGLDVTLVGGGPPRVRRFRVARRETSHKRHVKKYATGKLPPERSFHFRGPAGAYPVAVVAHGHPLPPSPSGN